ncbi:MAG: hypothetical protein ACLS98_11450, partial [Anaerobutyricum soehngenii]
IKTPPIFDRYIVPNIDGIIYFFNALSLERRVMPMTTMEVLTLLILVFAVLTYIDNHNKK